MSVAGTATSHWRAVPFSPTTGKLLQLQEVGAVLKERLGKWGCSRLRFHRAPPE
jgi:hypothetical protein